MLIGLENKSGRLSNLIAYTEYLSVFSSSTPTPLLRLHAAPPEDVMQRQYGESVSVTCCTSNDSFVFYFAGTSTEPVLSSSNPHEAGICMEINSSVSLVHEDWVGIGEPR